MPTTGALFFTGNIRIILSISGNCPAEPSDTFSFKSCDSSADATINFVTNPQREDSDDKGWEACQFSEKGLPVS